MKIIIGLLVIIPEVYTFLRFKPRNRDTVKILLINVLFGAMAMVSTLTFETAETAVVSSVIILMLAMMNFCFYAEVIRELRRRKRHAARIRNRAPREKTNVCSSGRIQFVA